MGGRLGYICIIRETEADCDAAAGGHHISYPTYIHTYRREIVHYYIRPNMAYIGIICIWETKK